MAILPHAFRSRRQQLSPDMRIHDKMGSEHHSHAREALCVELDSVGVRSNLGTPSTSSRDTDELCIDLSLLHMTYGVVRT
jgi:hypothetical protein